MSKRVVQCILGAGVLFLLGCDGVQFNISFFIPRRADDTQTQKIALAANDAIAIDNAVGDVRVSVDDAATGATLEITRIAYADSQAAADDLLTKIVVNVTEPTDADPTLRVSFARPAEVNAAAEDSNVDISENADGVTVITVKSDTLVAQVNLRLTVPPGHPLTVTQDNGNVRLIGTESTTSVKVRRGGIRAISTSGPLTLDVTNGSVNVDSHHGTLDVMTDTGSNDLRILGLDASDTVNAHTRVGQIDLTLPYRVNADLRAIADMGSIHFSRFDFAHTNNVVRTGDTVTAVLNDGGATIDIETETGDIEIDSR